MRLPVVFVAVGAVAVAGAARAQVDCADLPNPVYLQVGDTQEPLIKALGRQLRDSTTDPMTLVYLRASTCVNVEVFESFGRLATNPLYVPSSAEDAAWTPSSPSPSCTIAAGGVALDVANAATFISSCTTDPPPAGVVRVSGPVQGYAFVVPEASAETAITAEEAYFVYGFGNLGQVTPWNDEAFIYKRPTTASTLLTLMANVGVPGDRARGTNFERSGQLISAMNASTSPDKTIGILGVEVYDKNRATLNVLAFRAFDQRFAYYPDSTPTAFDKKNVRDGHYVPWSPTEWMYYENDDGTPVNPRARRVVDLITGAALSQPPDFDALATVIRTGLVPRCAMAVTRDFDGGELSLYAPAEPCGCFFDSEVDVAPASCVSCVDDTPCGAGRCRHGFCEER
jgi:hypothetical protein